MWGSIDHTAAHDHPAHHDSPWRHRVAASNRATMPIVTINPATGRQLRAYREHSPRAVARKIAQAHAAFQSWRGTSFAARARLLRSLARELRRDQAGYARLITEEMGKPVTQALAEIEKCALNCEFYAERGARFLASERPPGAPAHRYVSYQPLGVVLAIMPWNFPFWQVFRSAAPVIMAGNALLLKHAFNVSGCALAIEAVFRRAGAPVGLMQSLLLDGDRTSALLGDDRVAMVTFTGSTAVGRKVAAAAGAAMKRGVFELGGSDAYLILADADLVHAAEACTASRLYNAGQSCVAAKRFIVVEKVRAKFEKLFVARMAASAIGDPRVAATEVGPLARADLRDKLHAHVRQSIRRGAKLLLGGRLPAGPGLYYPPTILTGVKPGMAAYREELFGPVAAIIPAKDEAEAIRIANDTPYGLGAAVFTQKRKRGEHIARDLLEAGNGFVNEFVRSHPTLPFGGIKQSGHGRELGAAGIREFVNVKVISVS